MGGTSAKPAAPSETDAAAVSRYLNDLHDRITAAVEAVDTARFRRDAWQRPGGGGGESRMLSDGAVFERAGVSFSHVIRRQDAAVRLESASGNCRRALRGHGVVAGVSSAQSVRARPRTATSASSAAPPGPAAGMVVRRRLRSHALLSVRARTCCTGTARLAHACQPFGADVYPRYKDWCDRYFFLPHRNETRGVGGLFFDDLNEGGFERWFAFLRSVGDHFLPAYLPIVERRKAKPCGEREREFQLYRRGRYVEFNLVYDRGTLFGLQSRGRTESILMSMPPLARWDYDWHPEPGSPEARLYEFLRPRDYLAP